MTYNYQKFFKQRKKKQKRKKPSVKCFFLYKCISTTYKQTPPVYVCMYVFVSV